MEYVTHDESGVLTGSYSQDLRPEHEKNHIEVMPEERREWVRYRANDARDGLVLLPDPPPTSGQHNAPILAALLDIDAQTPRAVREALITGDNSRVQALEDEAAALRLQLRKD